MIDGSKNNSAVSPVIGTILLVAITVVLVAIIAAVVMGMSSSVSSIKEVGLTVTSQPYTRDEGGITGSRSSLLVAVTIYGGKDVSELRALHVSVAGSPGSLYVMGPNYLGYRWDVHHYGIGDPDAIFNASEIVGQSFYYGVIPMGSTVAFDNALCTVTGTFADGTSAVLYQTYITYHTPEGTTEAMDDLSSNGNSLEEIIKNTGAPFIGSPILI